MESGSDIEKGHVDESASVNVERGGRTVEQWKRTFDIKLWKAGSPLPFSCCIFKVPEVLRRQEEQAFKPDMVSIGPFHRGVDEKFKLVENVKEWYLNCLLSRMKINLDSLIEGTKGLEKLARGCYSDPCNHLDQNDFIEMLVLDGCFLIELFRKARFPERQDNDDPIFNVPCMLEYLYHDLQLLENQLPWFVLEFFYYQIESDNNPMPLSKLVIDFFKDSVANPEIFSTPNPVSNGFNLHILDLIRTSLVQEYKELIKLPRAYSRITTGHFPQRMPSAATLSDVGVKFQMGLSSCILNITFRNGVFTIPRLVIDERTGKLFRNIMAFEQCYHSCMHMITSYARLMGLLIDTKNDVDFLSERRIVASWLSDHDTTKFFNDLSIDTIVIDFVYKDLYDTVNAYCNAAYYQIPWSRWKKILRRDYFGTPWAAISFFAAFVLLVLTFLQTIYTIQPYYHPASE